jgi:hypothetical protein
MPTDIKCKEGAPEWNDKYCKYVCSDYQQPAGVCKWAKEQYQVKSGDAIHSANTAAATADFTKNSADGSKPAYDTTKDSNDGSKAAAPSASNFNTNPCVVMKDAGSCKATAECLWEDFSSKPMPLFTKEFCHPIKNADDKINNDAWAQCISKTGKDECNSNVNVCAWSNAADLIPDHDFCAPRDMTKDTGLINKCVDTKDAAACVDQC